jgi:MoxR-like ATPase
MNEFIGAYVGEVKEVALVSILSGQHATFVGAPGWGKTAILRRIGQRIFTQRALDTWSFTRLDPSTPVEVIRGPYSPAGILNGVLERVTDGTPYQDGNRLAILDEWPRANEPMFDSLLDTLDRQDLDNGEAPACWGTANFVVTGERTDALVDRFALWMWLTPESLDVVAMVNSQLVSAGKPDVAGDVPSWDEICAVRQYTPGPKAIAVVAQALEEIVVVAAQNGRSIHPRRLAQWSAIVYRYSAWLHGAAEFDTVPEEARRILQYAWPATTPEEAASWKQIVLSVVDRVAAAVSDALASCVDEFKHVAAINDVSDRKAASASLNALMMDAQTSLQALYEQTTDQRCKDAQQTIMDWFGQAMRGETITYGG